MQPSKEHSQLPIPQFLPAIRKRSPESPVFSALKSLREKKKQIQRQYTDDEHPKNYLQKVISIQKGRQKRIYTQSFQSKRINGFSQRASTEDPYIQEQVIRSVQKKPKKEKISIKINEEENNLLMKKLTVIPRQPSSRSKKDIRVLFNQVKHIRFFRRIDEYLGMCLLRINRIIQLEKGEYLYRKADLKNVFFIILEGSITLYNKENKFKEQFFQGDSINEDCLFIQNFKTKESAKSNSISFLLEFKKKDYRILGTQIYKNGFQNLFKGMEKVLFNNFSQKQAHRVSYVEKLKKYS